MTEMEQRNSYHLVFKNSLILTFLRVVEPLLAMVVIVAISRLLGPEVMGGYAFIITFIAMFAVIGQLGLQTLITREVAANKQESSSYLTAALFLGLCSSVLLGFMMNVSKGYFGLSGEVSLGVQLMSLNLFPMFVIGTFEAVFMGWERSDLIVYQHISGNLVRVALSLIFIWSGFGLVSLVVAIIISTLLSVMVCMYTYVRNLGKMSLHVNLGVAIRLLRSSPVFLLITLVTIVSSRVDVLILTKFTNMTQVALYAAAYKLLEATMIVPQSYMKASFPHLSALFGSDRRAFSQTNCKMLRHILFYVFPTAAVILALSPLLISVLYGAKFSSSALILQVLMIGLIPWTVGRTFANALVAGNLQKYDLISGVSGVIVSVGLNLWLIPLYGARGAAMASAFSLSAFFVCQLYFSRKSGYEVSLWEAARMPLAVGGAVFTIFWIARLGWPYACGECALLLGAAVFFFRKDRNRGYLNKPFVLLQHIIRA